MEKESLYNFPLRRSVYDNAAFGLNDWGEAVTLPREPPTWENLPQDLIPISEFSCTPRSSMYDEGGLSLVPAFASAAAAAEAVQSQVAVPAKQPPPKPARLSVAGDDELAAAAEVTAKGTPAPGEGVGGRDGLGARRPGGRSGRRVAAPRFPIDDKAGGSGSELSVHAQHRG